MYEQLIKRSLDFVLALVALLLLAPLILFVILVVAIANRGPVFFPQERPGRNAVPFTIYKFKTMNDAVDSSGELLPDEERITTVGRLVRKSSFDELLQLLNVLKGDMSLIGPRPLLMRYLPRYTENQARRHEVRPGITGLAQVKGRNALDWRHRFRYDVFYVDHLSFGLDLLILWWTIREVFFARGVEFTSEVTWEFMGTKSKHLKN